MRKWLLGAMCATFVVAASHDAGAFKDGNALLEYAESENEILNFLFIMYVAGVAAGARDVTIRWKVLGKLENRESDLSPPFCVPPKITHKDLADTVRLWLHSHPKLRGIPSGLSIIEALAERFPCK